VVSRSIVAEMRRTGSPHVWLDITSKEPEFIRKRFPRIHETCLAYGVDIAKDPAPVHPAAHYAMGGVKSDLNGRTTVDGLFAAGEVACTGVHGANRLASNSLLEAVVFGERAGRTMAQSPRGSGTAAGTAPRFLVPAISEAEVRGVAWEHCGITRDRKGLELALSRLSAAELRPAEVTLAATELRNIHQVAMLIAECGLWREESRGAHYREDYPAKRAEFLKPSSVRLAALAVSG